MKTHAFLPLATYPEANADIVVEHAVEVARRYGADLHAAALYADIPMVSNALSRLLLDVPEMIREAEALSRKRGDHLIDLVRRKAAAEGVVITTGEIATQTALLGDEAALQARYYDLSLIGWEAGSDTVRMVAEGVVFGAGRPTILLPEKAGTPNFDKIAVAWDGSRVAARALADARMFLEKASSVTVVTVLDEKPLKERDAGERLARELAGRGFPAKAASINAEDCPIAETLQRQAIDAGCGLLVMGGYGHSRMRDFVLGGATEGVLSELRLPVLLSH